MKYLKTFEGVQRQNIHVGEIYIIDEMLIALKGYLSNINLGKVINTFENNEFLDIKTYIKSTYEEYTLIHIHKRFIKRKATKNEILKFESIEMSKKYNL